MLEGLRVRIDPAKCADARDTIGVKVSDTGEQIGLAVRRGVLEALGTIPDDASAVIEAPKLIVTAMVYRGLSGTLAQAIDNGHAKLAKGDLDDAQRFFSYFDPPNPDLINLADR